MSFLTRDEYFHLITTPAAKRTMKGIFSHLLINSAKLINLSPKTNLLSLTLNVQRLTPYV
jgi:hypothetical protein